MNPRLAGAALALLPLLLASSGSARAASLPPWWPWPPPGGADDPAAAAHSAWAQTLEFLYNETEHRVGFCVGSRTRKVLVLLEQSFPWPLPAGPADDGLCSNRTALEPFLCGPDEIKQYYKYMLLTTDPEKVPDTLACTSGSPSPACSPGFFDASLGNRPFPGNTSQQPHACCEGYFCPPSLTCLMPCPLGGYCPRAWAAPPPDEYRGQGGGARWCAPYAYKERPALGCGGADRWSIIPSDPFPGTSWSAGSGSIFCEGGRYCPNTSAMLDCSRGHFCRQGSTEEERCPLGVKCGKRTEIPDNNFNGVVADAVLFLVLWVVWRLSVLYGALVRRLERRERLKVAWGAHPELTVVEEDGEAEPEPEQPLAGQLTPTGPGRLSASALSELDGGEAGQGVEGGAEEQAAGQGVSQQLAGMRLRAWLTWHWRRQSPAPGEVEWYAFHGADGYQSLPDGPASAAGAAAATELSPSPSRPLLLAVPRASSTRSLNGSATPEAAARNGSVNGLGPQGGSTAGVPLPGTRRRGRRRLRLEVEFRELGLRLRLTHKWVVRGVTGRLRASRTTAILGPSGAGKTSLLNTLSGRCSYGRVFGQVFVNGQRERLERLKRVMGFVPQDDIMSTSLTVEENLLFAARYRLPATATPAQHHAQVNRAVRTLALEDVRHELIGDEQTRGISGGQRKRVNVGLELVADPSVLFLDEPTSGLDSTASRTLVAALRSVVRGGVTAAAVIHQPSWETLSLFDDMLLLGKGGRTVYYGEVAEVQTYFVGLGYEIPTLQNPADVIMDICSGERTRPGQAPGDFASLFDAWDDHCGRPRTGTGSGTRSDAGTPDQGDRPGQGSAVPGNAENRPLEGGRPPSSASRQPSSAASLAPAASGELLLGGAKEQRSMRRRARELAVFCLAFLASTVADGWDAVRLRLIKLASAATRGRVPGRRRRQRRPSGEALLSEGESAEEEDKARGQAAAARRRATPGFWRQFCWCISRAALQRSRQPLRVLADYVIIALTGMTLGLISDRGRGTIMHFAVSITYSVVALGLMATVGALTTFSQHRLVFQREAASGLNRLSYFLALDTFDHGGTLLCAAVYMATWYSFAAPRAVLWQMYLVVAAIVYCCTGTAYLLTQLMEPASAQLAAAVLALINTLIARQGHPSGLVALAQSYSFARWGLEGLVISESNRLTGVWLLARCADLMGLQYDVRRFGLCLAALVGLGLAFRAAALALLFRSTAARRA